MIHSSEITIIGKNPEEILASHQRREVTCSLSFTGEKVRLDAHDSVTLNLDDCVSLRDFLDASIKTMQNETDD